MLTSDLVRATVREGVLRPRYVDPGSERLLEETAQLIEVFRAHVGDSRGELDEAVADHIGDSPGYLIQRGLAKLLMDRATFEVDSPADPAEMRAVVFGMAAEAWPVGQGRGATPREAVLAAAAERLGLEVAQVDAALYADLKGAEKLTEVDLPEARELLQRYNMSLAQAALLKANEVRVVVRGLAAKRARQLFAAIKFRQLMHRARREGNAYHIVLDGPLSLFRHTSRYGLQLALFLPTLCLADEWELRADVTWSGSGRGGRQRVPCELRLDSEMGLVSHARDRGTWKSDEERHFEATWAAGDLPWKLRSSARIVDLDGRGVLVPDYRLVHPDGREALLEIVWFWRKAAFARRLALLEEAGPPNLIVAVATRLNADEKAPELPRGAVYPFKGVISPKRVVALADEVGR